MADDSMEISSDHGHGGGDEDIDIDIDLAAGQADEDYILEDVASSIEGENIENHPFHSAGDDAMLDEQDSYPSNDLDTIFEGQGHEMDGDVLGMSMTSANEPSAGDDQYATNTQALAELPSKDQTELSWEEDPIPIFEQNTEQIGLAGSAAHEGEGHVQDAGIVESTEQSRLDEEHNSRTITPGAVSPERFQIEEPRSPPATSPEGRSTSQEVSHDQISNDNMNNLLNTQSTDQEEPIISGVSNNRDDLRAIHTITVIYQSTEYTLFGALDAEDPDSFFLSDLSITDQKISDFFKAIRDVIHEDLAPDDELCLSIEELGLEIEEVVSSLHDVTLSQIYDLHQKLLVNDGTESPPPLCICLGTRPSFAKRLANLMADAEAGKGLSKILTLDEHEDEPPNEYEATGEDSDDQLWTINPVEENKGNETENQVASPPLDQEDHHQELSNIGEEQPQEEESIGAQKLVDEKQPQSHATDHSNMPQTTPGNLRNLSKKPLAYGSELDEDGDLIDYSEDEGPHFVEDELTGFQSAQLLNANDEVTDVQLGDDSRKSEDPEQASHLQLDKEQLQNEHFPAASPAKVENSLEGFLDVGDEYDETGKGEEWDVIDNYGGFEDLPAETADAHLGFDEQVYQSPNEGGNTENALDLEIQTEGESYSDETSLKILEIEEAVTDNHKAVGDRITISSPTDAAPTSNGYANEQHISSELQESVNAETATGMEDSQTVPDNSRDQSTPAHLEKAPSANVEDEIGYEDDEEYQVTEPSQNDTHREKQMTSTNGAPGKRTRTDADSDEAMASRVKDAKRLRP